MQESQFPSTLLDVAKMEEVQNKCPGFLVWDSNTKVRYQGQEAFTLESEGLGSES